MIKVLVSGLSGMALFGMLLFFGSILCTVLGALGGEVVSWFFADTFRAAQVRLGIDEFQLWQVGAVLGFVCGFLPRNRTIKSQ